MTGWIWMIGVAAAIFAGLGLFYLVLPWIFNRMVRVLLLPRYGFRTWGRENLPRRGPVVVIANHSTWLDGFFLAAVFPRQGKALVNAGFVKNPIVRLFARRSGLIPVPFSGPKAQRAAIQACRDLIDAGGALVIFPEGQLTRTGFLGPFYRGLELILKDREHIPVVPVYMDHLWGSIWGFSDGRCFRKRPKGLRRVIRVGFGPPIPGPVDLFRVRQGLLEAAVAPVSHRLHKPEEPETIDPSLPHYRHPNYKLLAASAPDFERDGIRQLGWREGTVGHPLPGVVIRAVDDEGHPLPADAVGRLQAKVAGQPTHWLGLGKRGSIDRDGFVRVF